MYERFSDRARKSLQLAQQEAHRLDDEFVGTEHMLLGLAKEQQSVAATALRNLGVDLQQVRSEIERMRRDER